MKLHARLTLLTTSLVLLSVISVDGGDWPQFRGSNGDGISTDGPIPTKWDAAANLKWKADLPGKGSSSPIVLGDRIFVTCY